MSKHVKSGWSMPLGNRAYFLYFPQEWDTITFKISERVMLGNITLYYPSPENMF